MITPRTLARSKADEVEGSTLVSTLSGEELTTTAKRRGLEAPKLIHQLRGDLDWIVMKCLEKDRGRRYDTANGLARDIDRYMNNEPVMARPPSRAYRFQKLIGRNKLAFSAAGAVLTALLLGLGLSTWLFLRERAGRREQAHLRNEAQTEATKSQQVAKFLTDMLDGVGPSKALGRDTTMLQEILVKKGTCHAATALRIEYSVPRTLSRKLSGTLSA
jgi:hypothetical protein